MATEMYLILVISHWVTAAVVCLRVASLIQRCTNAYNEYPVSVRSRVMHAVVNAGRYLCLELSF